MRLARFVSFFLWIMSILVFVNEGIALENPKKEILTPLKSKFEHVNFSGSYLAARSARRHYNFATAQKNAENSFVLADMGHSYLADQVIRLSFIQQDFDTAIEMAQQHLKKIKKLRETQKNTQLSAYALITILIDAIKKDNPEKALQIFESYQESFNKPMRALIGGTVYRFNKKLKKAELIEANLNGFALFDMMRSFHAANSAYVQNDSQKALLLFKKSGKYLDPLAVRSILSGMQILLQDNKKNEALALIKAHQKKQPDGLLWAASQSLEKNEQFNFDLPSQFLQVLGEDFYNIGVLYARQRDYESAISFFRIAQIAGINHAYLLSALAETYAFVKDFDQSSKIYLSIAKSDKLLIGRESLIGAAFTLNAAKKYAESDRLLKDAIEADPKYYRYPYILADIYRGREHHKQAITYFTRALELSKSIGDEIKWQILYGRGICYEQTNQWKKAEKDLLEALKLAPHNPDLINYLAYSWVDRDIYLERALNMLKLAVSRRPDSGYITDSLGWALFRTGKYELALPILERAIALMPHDPVINDHLGDVYWKMGRHSEARFQWRHALDFKIDEKKHPHIEAKIEVGYEQAARYTPKIKNLNLHEAPTETHGTSLFNLIKSFFTKSGT